MNIKNMKVPMTKIDLLRVFYKNAKDFIKMRVICYG